MICKVFVYTFRIFYAILEKNPLNHHNRDTEKIMKYDIKSLTLDEKLHLLTGKDTWRLTNANGKLPEVYLSDGPNGLRIRTNFDTRSLRDAKNKIAVIPQTKNTVLKPCLFHIWEVRQRFFCFLAVLAVFIFKYAK